MHCFSFLLIFPSCLYGFITCVDSFRINSTDEDLHFIPGR